mgnify:CR=1 FL=1
MKTDYYLKILNNLFHVHFSFADGEGVVASEDPVKCHAVRADPFAGDMGHLAPMLLAGGGQSFEPMGVGEFGRSIASMIRWKASLL